MDALGELAVAVLKRAMCHAIETIALPDGDRKRMNL
jgi:hypothetical protein